MITPPDISIVGATVVGIVVSAGVGTVVVAGAVSSNTAEAAIAHAPMDVVATKKKSARRIIPGVDMVSPSCSLCATPKRFGTGGVPTLHDARPLRANLVASVLLGD
jgi:hypothetical protein